MDRAYLENIEEEKRYLAETYIVYHDDFVEVEIERETLDENQFKEIVQEAWEKDSEDAKYMLFRCYWYLMTPTIKKIKIENLDEDTKETYKEKVQERIDFLHALIEKSLEIENPSREKVLMFLKREIKIEMESEQHMRSLLDAEECEPLEEEELYEVIEAAKSEDEGAKWKLILSYYRMMYKYAGKGMIWTVLEQKKKEETEDAHQEQTDNGYKRKKLYTIKKSRREVFDWLAAEMEDLCFNTDKNGVLKLKKYDREKAPFTPYMMKVFENTIIKKYKALERQPDAVPVRLDGVYNQDGEEIKDPIAVQEFKDYQRESFAQEKKSMEEDYVDDVLKKLEDYGEEDVVIFHKTVKSFGADGFDQSDAVKSKVMECFVTNKVLKKAVGLSDVLSEMGVRTDAISIEEENGKVILSIKNGSRIDVDEESGKWILELRREYHNVESFDRLSKEVQQVIKESTLEPMEDKTLKDRILEEKTYIDKFEALLKKGRACISSGNLSNSLKKYMEEESFSFEQKDFGHVFQNGYIGKGKKMPLRNEVIAIAFMEGMDAEQLDDLLKACGCSALYVRQPFDLVVKYALNKKMSLSQYLDFVRDLDLKLYNEIEQQAFYESKYTIGDIRKALESYQDKEDEIAQTVTDRVSRELDALVSKGSSEKEFCKWMKTHRSDFTLIRQRTYRVLMESFLAYVDKDEKRYQDGLLMEDPVTSPIKAELDRRSLDGVEFVRRVEKFSGVQFPETKKGEMTKNLNHLCSYFETNIYKKDMIYPFNINRDLFLALFVFLNQSKRGDIDRFRVIINEALRKCGFEELDNAVPYDKAIEIVAQKGQRSRLEKDAESTDAAEAYLMFAKGFYHIIASHSASQYAFLTDSTKVMFPEKKKKENRIKKEEK